MVFNTPFNYILEETRAPGENHEHKRPCNMAMDIKILAWGQADKCGGVKPVNGILTIPLLIIGSPMTTQI